METLERRREVTAKSIRGVLEGLFGSPKSKDHDTSGSLLAPPFHGNLHLVAWEASVLLKHLYESALIVLAFEAWTADKEGKGLCRCPYHIISSCVHTYVFTYADMHKMYICMYIYIYVYTYICLYTELHVMVYTSCTLDLGRDAGLNLFKRSPQRKPAGSRGSCSAVSDAMASPLVRITYMVYFPT